MGAFSKKPPSKVPTSRPAKAGNDAVSSTHRSVWQKTQRTLGNQATQRLVRAPATRAKLRVSQPNDGEEQQAERVSEQVMRTPPQEVKERRPVPPSGRELPPQGPAHVQNAIGSGGHPLDSESRSFFEPRFGADLDRVRVHADSAAGQSAEALDARAYTLGSDIVFGAGEYRPGAESGRRLLAHELAHVMQSSGAASTIGTTTLYRQPGGSTPEQRLHKAKGLLMKTELGQNALRWLAGYRKRPSALSHSLEEAEIKIELRKGVESFYDPGNRKIVLNEDETAEEMALSLIDLQNRTVVERDPLKVDRETYSSSSMSVVIEGAIDRIEFKRELQALGATFPAAVALEAEYAMAYSTTYAEALPLDAVRTVRDIGPDAKYKAQTAARQAVSQAIKANQPIAGGTRQQYVESLGKDWDQARAEQARRDAEYAERSRIEAEQQARADATVNTLALIVNKVDPESPAADQVIRLVEAIVPSLGVSRFSFYNQAHDGLERLLGPFGYRTVVGVGTAALQAERLEYALANYAALDPKQRAELRRDPFAPVRYGIQVGPTRAEQFAEDQIVAYRILPDGSLHVGPLSEFRQAEEQNKINHALEQIEAIRNAGPGALVGRIVGGEEGAAIGAMADSGFMILAPVKARRDVRKKISQGWQSPGTPTPLQPEAIRQSAEPELKMPRKLDVTQGSAFTATPAVEPAPAVAAPASPANVWVNTRTGRYHLPGMRYYGRTAEGGYMTLAEAQAAGHVRAGTRPPSGVYSVQRPSEGDTRVVIKSWIGAGQRRANLEKAMMSASRYAARALRGFERAHSQSAGLGGESGEAIRLASQLVNQTLQNRGIERFMRELRDLAQGERLHLTTETKTQPQTLRLQSIHYLVERPEGARMITLFEAAIEMRPDGTARAGVRMAGSDAYTFGPWFEL